MNPHNDNNTPAGNSGRKRNKKKDYSTVTRVLLGVCIVFGVALCVLIGLKIKEDTGAEKNAQTLLEAYKQKEESQDTIVQNNADDSSPTVSNDTTNESTETSKAAESTATNEVAASTSVTMENTEETATVRDKTAEEIQQDTLVAQQGEENRFDAENDEQVDETADYVAPEEPSEEEALSTIDKIVNSVGADGVIGIIEIPKYDQEYPIIGQWSYKLLKISICKYKGPDVNEKGNLVLLGHNYKSGAHFGNLKKLKVGDEVFLTSPGSDMRVRYEVYNITNIEPDNFAAVDKTKGEYGLTLMTCTNQGNRRKLVRCVRKAATSDVDCFMNAKVNPYTT